MYIKECGQYFQQIVEINISSLSGRKCGCLLTGLAKKKKVCRDLHSAVSIGFSSQSARGGSDFPVGFVSSSVISGVASCQHNGPKTAHAAHQLGIVMENARPLRPITVFLPRARASSFTPMPFCFRHAHLDVMYHLCMYCDGSVICNFWQQ